MVTALWIAWIVFCCGFTLVRMLQPHSNAASLLVPIVLLGAMSWFVWLTDGRFAGFTVLGSIVAYAGLMLLLRARAENAKGGALKSAARSLISPAMFFGALIGGAIEIGGRWSGSQFVVWRAAVAGTVVLAAGMALFIRATGAPADEQGPQD